MPDPLELAMVALLALGGLLWLWVLVDCLRNEPSGGYEKLVWVLVILLANALWAVLYLIVRRPKRIQQFGK